MGSNPCFFRKMSVKVNLQDHLAVDLVLYMSLSCRMYYLCHECTYVEGIKILIGSGFYFVILQTLVGSEYMFLVSLHLI